MKFINFSICLLVIFILVSDTHSGLVTNKSAIGKSRKIRSSRNLSNNLYVVFWTGTTRYVINCAIPCRKTARGRYMEPNCATTIFPYLCGFCRVTFKCQKTHKYF